MDESKPAVWDGTPGQPTRRIGHAPEDIPRDGAWYIMRTSEWVDTTASRTAKRTVSQRIGQAVKYLKKQQIPGFEAHKIREDEGGECRWHMLGRWTV